MQFEFFVAMRYLRAKHKLSFAKLISGISVAGVALGVAALIVAMGVMNGFSTDFRNKILGINPQILIQGFTQDHGEIREQLLAVPGVKAVTPQLYTELMISTSSRAKGVLLRGIDVATAPEVITILKELDSGKVESLNDYKADGTGEQNLPGLILGKQLAERMNIVPGHRVHLLAPSGTQSSSGYSPRIRTFMVTGLFSTGMSEVDLYMAFTSLEAARPMLGLRGGDWVSGFELALDDVFAADKVAEEIRKILGPDFRVYPWMETNANLMAALKLEKLALGIVLGLLILIGSFSIITTLIMLVMEKTRDIAIMMSMGATSGAVRRIFMLQGVIIGVIGTISGFILGLGLCFLLKHYKFIKLPAGVYLVDYVPVLLEGPELVATAVGAMLICFLATIYPAGQAARLVPVEALRSE
ncbi:ABC transporter permease [Desulfovibrio sp. OttesenSCG-928-C14]|nr:ABC transporter permease [Desulfovibrio sp. OttesenSCG-928-C14]